MIKEPWQSAIPNFEQFEDVLSQVNTITPLSFLDLQPRLKSTIIRFGQIKRFPRIMLINAPENFIYRQAITESYQTLIETNQISECPFITTDSLEAKDIFGQYQIQDGNITHYSKGLLDKANGGYLMISANLILSNPKSWSKLKSAILGDACSPFNSDQRQVSVEIPTTVYDVKLIILGDRFQLGELDLFDADILSELCLFTEIELDFKIDDKASFQQYLGYVKGIIQKEELADLHDAIAWQALLNQGARETEDQSRMPLCLLWHNALLSEINIESNYQNITTSHIQNALIHKQDRQSYLPLRALDDILEGQVIIETDGERIGQVNGLTVIEIPGHPVTYGEPARISCVIHFGDGDIADVERKAELGGNLHAKGMMIMQAFLASALNLDDPLPFAASIVFEQSYSEVDGDSASLAELCSLVSALSEYPIKQSIAVTGAVDQFGRVQAVGGLNEKIEGFFHICKHNGLTGEQGVILPKTNLKHLSLNQDIVTALKNDQFHLWSVESVDEALPLILGKAFRGNDEETILKRISERIEHFDKHDDKSCNLIDKIKNLFGSH